MSTLVPTTDEKFEKYLKSGQSKVRQVLDAFYAGSPVTSATRTRERLAFVLWGRFGFRVLSYDGELTLEAWTEEARRLWTGPRLAMFVDKHPTDEGVRGPTFWLPCRPGDTPERITIPYGGSWEGDRLITFLRQDWGYVSEALDRSWRESAGDTRTV